MVFGIRHIAGVLCAVSLMGCSHNGIHGGGSHPADELNSKSYAWRYRNLDSAAHYASLAYDEAGRYRHGRSVASNMLGFVAFMRMDYAESLAHYEEVTAHHGCELECLAADVGKMKVYLRTADNLAFYDCRVSAMKRVAHIDEEVDRFSSMELRRFQSVVNELYMTTALHHHMIGQRPEAHAEMALIPDDEALRRDSAQWLMVQYFRGLGLDVDGDTYEQRLLHRYTHLNNCLREGREGGYAYFEGLALSGLAQLLADSVRNAYISQQRPNSYSRINDGMERGVFPLAETALHRLHSYGDSYGVLNAKVQMASLYNRTGEYAIALDTLQSMLVDSILSPDVLCRLHEETSLSYAGLGDKAASDHHRNLYLDMLEKTRQNKEWESRYLSLKRQRRTMNLLLVATLVGIALLAFLIMAVTRHRRRRGGGYEQQLRDLLQETEKSVYLHQRHIEAGKRDNIRRKASFSIVTGIMPYIDRMAHEVERLQLSEVWDDTEVRERKIQYIAELADEINNLNEILSQWIRTTQGIVNLHIESFPLTEVFDMIERSKTSFVHKGLSLDVQPTDAIVKADKALTFFMLNTLADNARKFTPTGGCVSVKAEEFEQYVELSVSDNGVGMSSDDINRILNEKVYDTTSIGLDLPSEQRKNKGSGFGLLNCKGIIDKYRKTDTLFDVCGMGIDSRVGDGCRFWFRLPKGLRRVLIMLAVGLVPYNMQAVDDTFAIPADTLMHVVPTDASDERELSYDSLLVKASAFADSVYYANVDSRYAEAIVYADSAIFYLNVHHSKYAAPYIAPLTVSVGESDVETRWWLSDYATDYHTILDIRNELAVANLALRRWDDYRYNNHIYNDLYKLISEDRSLIDYCDRMQRYNSNISMAVLLCVLLILGYLAIILYSYMGRVESTCRNIESVEDEERRARYEKNRLHVHNMVLDNCLSTIKHETVYYPNRLRQLVNRLGQHDERTQMKELIDYYKVIFTTLVGCASRQLDEVVFRRTDENVMTLLSRAASYHASAVLHCSDAPALIVEESSDVVQCDTDLIGFLLEQLVDASLAQCQTDRLVLKASAEGEFVRITLANTSRSLASDVLNMLFYPMASHVGNVNDGRLQGTEYVVCRQIIREHDDYFNHIGCRIKAEQTVDGYQVLFTLPRCL